MKLEMLPYKNVNLKTNNPTLHAMVKQMLVDMKQQVASDAVAQSQAPQG